MKTGEKETEEKRFFFLQQIQCILLFNSSEAQVRKKADVWYSFQIKYKWPQMKENIISLQYFWEP